MTTDACESQAAKVGTIKLGGRTVLTPEAAVTHNNCVALEERIDAAMADHKTEVILDCKKVAYFDSAALTLLFRCHEKMRDTGGALKIVSLNEVCRDILVATRLINCLFVFEDVHKAVTCRL